MDQLTRRCLLTVSLLLAVAVAHAGDWLLTLGGRQQFTVAIAARGTQLTGLCIVRTDADGSSRGTVVNEFGIHALDFTLTADRRRMRLHNVMPWMDRWYIRRVVRRDLQRLFAATAAGDLGHRRHLSVEADGTVVLENEKYNLKYSFKQSDDTEE
jgi:hypothetical protein